MPQLAPDSRTRLRKALVEYFTLDELDTLCYDLGVDPDSVPGRGRDKGTRVREIVTYFESRSRLADLVALCVKERPNVPWADYLRFAPPSTPTAHMTPPAPVGPQGRGLALLVLLLVVVLVGAGVIYALRGWLAGEAGATDSPPASVAAITSADGIVQSTATAGAADSVTQSTASPTLALLQASDLTSTAEPPAALNVTNTTGRSIKPALIVDGAGVLHLTWLDDTLRQGQPDLFKADVLHRQRLPDGQWSDITNLTEGFRSVTDNHLELLRNPAGEPCAIWQGDDSREDFDGIYMRCLTGGQWSPAQLVEGSDRSTIASAFAPDGRLITIRSFAPNYTPFFGDMDLSDGLKKDVSNIQFAIDATGGYHLAWVRYGDPISVEYRTSIDGGVTWAPAIRLSTDETKPSGSWLQLAADAAGAVHLVYGVSGGGSIYRRWTPDGGWEATVDLGRFSLPNPIQDVVVDEAGRVYGVWHTAFDEILYAHQQPDGAWTSQIVAAAGEEGAALALDTLGAAHIAWELYDDTRDIYYASVP